ncbi:hypothetical protein [Kibdelosporangium aridum]
MQAIERSKRVQAVNQQLGQVEFSSETAKALLARIRSAKVKPAQ